MVDLEVQYQIANAPVREFPYPHILVHDIFPADSIASCARTFPTKARSPRSASSGGWKAPTTPRAW